MTGCLQSIQVRCTILADDGLQRLRSRIARKNCRLPKSTDGRGSLPAISAVIAPPLFYCQPHGFRAVATAAVHPTPYQVLSALRTRHREDTLEVPLNFGLPSRGPLDFRSPRIENRPLELRALMK
jgi:hypothetical protein